MKKDTRPSAGDSKSIVNAPAAAKTARPQQQQTSSASRLEASGPGPSVSVNARYIDSRMKQFCLR